ARIDAARVGRECRVVHRPYARVVVRVVDDDRPPAHLLEAARVARGGSNTTVEEDERAPDARAAAGPEHVVAVLGDEGPPSPVVVSAPRDLHERATGVCARLDGGAVAQKQSVLARAAGPPRQEGVAEEPQRALVAQVDRVRAVRTEPARIRVEKGVGL